jgi:hypothetical protein
MLRTIRTHTSGSCSNSFLKDFGFWSLSIQLTWAFASNWYGAGGFPLVSDVNDIISGMPKLLRQPMFTLVDPLQMAVIGETVPTGLSLLRRRLIRENSGDEPGSIMSGYKHSAYLPTRSGDKSCKRKSIVKSGQCEAQLREKIRLEKILPPFWELCHPIRQGPPSAHPTSLQKIPCIENWVPSPFACAVWRVRKFSWHDTMSGGLLTTSSGSGQSTMNWALKLTGIDNECCLNKLMMPVLMSVCVDYCTIASCWEVAQNAGTSYSKSNAGTSYSKSNAGTSYSKSNAGTSYSKSNAGTSYSKSNHVNGTDRKLQRSWSEVEVHADSDIWQVYQKRAESMLIRQVQKKLRPHDHAFVQTLCASLLALFAHHVLNTCPPAQLKPRENPEAIIQGTELANRFWRQGKQGSHQQRGLHPSAQLPHGWHRQRGQRWIPVDPAGMNMVSGSKWMRDSSRCETQVDEVPS